MIRHRNDIHYWKKGLNSFKIVAVFGIFPSSEINSTLWSAIIIFARNYDWGMKNDFHALSSGRFNC
jgi:hypothetical protein